MFQALRVNAYILKVRKKVGIRHDPWLCGFSPRDDETNAFIELCAVYWHIGEPAEAAAQCIAETCIDFRGEDNKFGLFPPSYSYYKAFMSSEACSKEFDLQMNALR